jgi:ketosteroid isomerase-like protein
MSPENVRVVESAFAALTRGGPDAFSDYWADDIEWRTMREHWHGKEAGRAYLQELFDLFDEFTGEPIEFIDAGELVVLFLRYGGRLKRSGLAVPPEYFAIVMRIRDGKIVQGVEYATRGEALEAAGLRE